MTAKDAANTLIHRLRRFNALTSMEEETTVFDLMKTMLLLYVDLWVFSFLAVVTLIWKVIRWNIGISFTGDWGEKDSMP